jgi:lysophospholipase
MTSETDDSVNRKGVRGHTLATLLAVSVLTLGAVFCGAQGSPGGLQVHPPSGLPERFLAPTGIQWGYFQNADAARIRYSHVPVGTGKVKATVVLVPGHDEFGEKYFEVMRDLVGRGYEVWQMDWRGYGGSDRYLAEREKAHSLGVDHDTRDLERFVRSIVKSAPGKPLILIAHSMGAHLGVRYLHDYPGRFTAAVLCSPFLSLSPEASQGMPAWMVRALIEGANLLGLRESWAKGNGPWLDEPAERLSHDLVRNDIQRQWSRASPVLRVGGKTNGWVREYLRSFDLMNKPGYYSAIKLPVLLGSACGDVLTRPDVHVRACSEMASCRLVRFEGAWHELFMESEPFRSRWLDAISAFLGEQASL